MNRLIKISAFSFMWNIIIGIIFIVFYDNIIERSDIALLVGIGSVIVTSIAFMCGLISFYIYQFIRIRRSKKMDQNS